jgi:hypothetical protein
MLAGGSGPAIVRRSIADGRPRCLRYNPGVRRRLLNVLTVLSLLLCLAVCVLWVRSLRVDTTLSHYHVVATPRPSLRTRWFMSAKGRIGFAISDLYLRQADIEDMTQSVRRHPYTFRERPPLRLPAGLSSDWTWGFRRVTQSSSTVGREQVQLLGFVVQSNTYRDSQQSDVWFPDWFIAALLATPASAWLGVHIRKTRRLNRGLCAHCAYDLRGNPAAGRCAECGAPAPATQVPAPAQG